MPTPELLRAAKCGFYLDFFFKKLAEVLVRNMLICGGQFFGEKYMVEVLTKNALERLISLAASLADQSRTSTRNVFYNVITVALSATSLILVAYLLF